jgi:iron complex outermembrane receptor protein
MNGRFLRNLLCLTAFVVLLCPTDAFANQAGGQLTQQQQINVTGRVTDADGAPMAGVTVLVEGTSAVAITDGEGSYSIAAQGSTSVLAFSFVGYTTQNVTLGSQTVVNVTMEADSEMIDAVVVTAMGITREQRTLGYAMTQVSGEEIAKANVVNPIQGLQGKVAGVQIDMGSGGPQSSQRIVIRGNTSLSGNNQPIFIIDGIIVDNEVTKTGGKAERDFGNELKGLNADDFESVSILKGAAATALYGSRASNGVILITTKKGQKMQGLGISVSQTIQFEDVYRLPDFQQEYGMGTEQLWAQAGGQDIRDNIAVTSQQWGPKYDGLPYSTGEYNGIWKAYKNNIDPLFKNGFYRNTNVAVQGGTDLSSYRLSYSTMKDSNLSPNNDMKRNNIMFRASHEISKFLTAEASFTYTDVLSRNPTKQGGDGSPMYDLIYSIPLNYDTEYWMQNYWSANRDGFNNTDPFGYTDNLFDAFENNELQGETTYRGFANLNFKFTDWLNLKLGADMNRLYTKYEKKTLASGSSSYENFAGSGYTLNESQKLQYRLNAMLSANRTFGDFNLGAYVGAESADERQ